MKKFKDYVEDIGGTSTASVVGTGDDNLTVVMRKKYDKKKKRKDQIDTLKKIMGEKSKK